jgi:hypothetical protein
MFAVANPLHPGVFPGVRKMEAEIVAMVDFIEASLMNRSLSCTMPPKAREVPLQVAEQKAF